NPIRSASVVSFSLPNQGVASVEVFDPAGRHVATLAEGILQAGRRETIWDGTDRAGRRLPAGIYLVRLETRDGIVRTRRITLLP
ncbi:MAG: T9SS type A sorting domain-containing protein, partial [Candidatus Eisenbacteria bacterium]|nr:T9SS type A sorting domain-containing protein [Candidatus Latescibacterota bacterium]MBD3300814.1 T9SS type A sorting domain-containing protein [Candidatus Eisenbacteria bacterium]